MVPGKQGSASLQELAEPDPRDGTILVRTLALGVYGTDAEMIDELYAPLDALFDSRSADDSRNVARVFGSDGDRTKRREGWPAGESPLGPPSRLTPKVAKFWRQAVTVDTEAEK